LTEIVKARAGIDTFSACWHVEEDSPAARAMDALATQPASRGRLIPEAVAGYRVGWHSGVGMVYAEGHPAGPDALASPDCLPEAARAVEDELRGRGVALAPQRSHRGSRTAQTSDRGGFSGVRRVDATVDLEVASAEDGLALLTAVAAVATVTPRAQADVRFAKDGSGGVETVYLRGLAGKKVLGRWYDKGLEAIGPAQRGLRVRAEDQRRYASGRRPAVEQVTSNEVRANFQARFYPMWQATKGIKVLAQASLIHELHDRVRAGAMRPTTAEKLAGYVVMRRSQARPGGAADKRRDRRRRQQFRELGLVQAPAALSEVEVDLHQVLEQVLEAGLWERHG
jgi:hypothetical protein